MKNKFISATTCSIQKTIINYFILTLYLFIKTISCASPQVYYVNIGDTATLQCNSGMFACYSTYTFQNTLHPMVMLKSGRKYQISSGSIIINNVQQNDAGFYTCASSCDQLKSDQISYFLNPMSNGQPIDTGKNWLAIPPLPSLAKPTNDDLYVVVSDERLYAIPKGLSGGEIAGLVVGLVAAFLITLAIIGLLIFLARRRNQNREKILKRSEKDATSVDYSTIERDYGGGESGTNTLTKDNNQQHMDNRDEGKSLAKNKSDTSNLANIVSEINTRNIKGPQSYKLNELNMMNQQELPNIDIGFNNNKPGSQRIQPNINQMLDMQFDNQQNIKPNQNNKPKVQFPSKTNKQEQRPQQVSNENIYLQQIIKESGFMSDMLDAAGYNRNDSELSKKDPQRKNSYQNDVVANELDRSQQLVNLDNEGGVTVVSARTPARTDQNLKVLPPSYNPNKFPFQQQQQQPYQPPRQNQLSLSQRIETTSTPLQLNPPPSQSLRTAIPSLTANNLFRDGATDV